jgi:hypothetical protein
MSSRITLANLITVLLSDYLAERNRKKAKAGNEANATSALPHHGPDGPEARAIARELNRQWAAVRAQRAPQLRLTLVPLGYQLLEQLNADLERRRKQTPSNFCSDFSSDIPRQPLYSAPTAPLILAGADVDW